MRGLSFFSRFVAVISASIFVVSSICPAIAQDIEMKEPLSERIEKIVLHKSGISGEKLEAGAYLKVFYANRSYEPAWIRDEKPKGQARDLLTAIDAADADGLPSYLYHKAKVDELIASGSDPAALDVLLTDAYFMLASNLGTGITNPFSHAVALFKTPLNIDYGIILTHALEKDEVAQSIDSLRFASPAYKMMKDSLARYKKIAADGGWEKLPEPPKLPNDAKIEPGFREPWIASLRNRLAVTDGPIAAPAPGAEDIYDENLADAVRKFQRRHGLNDDAVIGKWTIDALQVPAEDRICQIRINLDRLRAFARAIESGRFIVVNIPSYGVNVYENGKSALEMKAIVGTYNNKTPLLTDEMEYVVFSPRWNVPDSIARKEEFAKLREDPQTFKKRGMRVYHGRGSERVEVDYENYDWSQADMPASEYKIVQDPGGANALGRIKFLFPNDDDVYLHDTPTKPLFQKDVRAFSHGCIRIEKPFELAEYLLEPAGEWNRERIDKAANGGHEMFVKLPEKIPIHLVYITAWADGSGTTNFRRDVYNFDKKLTKLFCSR